MGAALAVMGCAKKHREDPREEVDGSVAPDGTVDGDAQVTQPDGGEANEPCLPETGLPCDCGDGVIGYQYCTDDRVWGSCECPVAAPIPGDDGGPGGGPEDGGSNPWTDGGYPDGAVVDGGGLASDGGPATDGGRPDPQPPGGCTGDPEWCDGYDNDCDGVADNGEVCPDASIAHTHPFDGSVWLSRWGSGSKAVMQVWPTPDPSTLRDLAERRSSNFLVGPRGDLYASGNGIVRYGDGGDFTIVPTPPCFDEVRPGFGFDGLGRLVYRCDDTLRRANGELMNDDFSQSIRAVLTNGRMVVLDFMSTNVTFVEPDGSFVSEAPTSEWVGSMYLTFALAMEDLAYVTFARTYRRGTCQEAVVFRVDGVTGRWSKVRRVPISSDGQPSLIGLPDGTVIQRLDASVEQGDDFLVEYPPGGAARVVWHEPSITPPLYQNKGHEYVVP
ncbi:MAG: hypothetical protein ACOCXM_09560 [Myxococcota bacterium]